MGPGLHLHEADTDAVDKVENLRSSKCKENTPEPGHLNKGCWQRKQRDQKHLGSVGWVGEGVNQVEMSTGEVGRAEWQRF